MMVENTSEELRRTARQFVAKELYPLEREVEEQDEVPAGVIKQMQDGGYFGLRLPEQYGGAGLSFAEYAGVVQEFGRTSWAFFGVFDDNNGMGSELILDLGTDEQKERVLPGMARGDALGCFALTEPEAGSDAGGIRTTAIRDGDGYILNGTKQFISNACKADYFTVIARTGIDRPGHSAFLVERGAAGLEVGPPERMMGWRGACQHQLIFVDCRVDGGARLGQEGQGLKGAFEALKTGRLIVAAWALGAATRALELGTVYASQRRQFGQPIGEFQGVQWLIADSAAELAAAAALFDVTVQRLEAKEAKVRDAAMAKLIATECASEVADRMIQVHGGIGLSKDLPVERIYRDLRACRIIEGTSEIQRSIIARSLLKDVGMPSS